MQAGSGISAAAGSIGIQATVTCIRCRYNLRGLPADAACPECGEAIRISLSPDRLVRADLQWLKRVAAGADLILGGILLGAVMFAALCALVMSLTPEPVTAGVLTWALAILPGLIIAWGCIWVTAPEQGRGSGFSEWSRKLARASALVIIALAAVIGPVYAVVPPGSVFLFLIGCIAATVGGFAALAYGDDVALRIPDRRLSSTTRKLALLYGLLLAGAGVAALLTSVAGAQALLAIDGEASHPAFGFVAVAAVIGAFCEMAGLGIAGVWTVALLVWYRFALRQVIAAREAD